MYNFTEIEKKWQNYWKENNTFKVNIWDFSKPKYYALDMSHIHLVWGFMQGTLKVIPQQI